jgi:hypothetical protein
VIHSVVGQNERWAQLTAFQPPPTAQSGQGAGSAFSNVGTTAADPSVVNPVAGSGLTVVEQHEFHADDVWRRP